MLSLRAFGAGGDEEAYALTFVQGFVAVAFDLAEVNEYVRTLLRGDEAETFLGVEPLNDTVLTSRHVVISKV
ncbi:hypothetical protein D3C78_1884910 [compost metagenome]